MTIEMIFLMFEDKELALAVGELPTLPKPDKTAINLKMQSSSSHVNSKGNTTLEPAFSNNKVENIPSLDFYFSKLDSLLNELKTNINSAHEDRLKQIKDEIEVQMVALQGLSEKALSNHMPTYMNLIHAFSDLKNYKEFSDIGPVLNKVFETLGRDTGKPDDALLESNPEEY